MYRKVFLCKLNKRRQYILLPTAELTPNLKKMRHLLVLLTVTMTARQGSALEHQQYCGNWQSYYTALHKSILERKEPQRFLISTPPFTGLADKLVGIPTLLLWALITNRALLTVTNHNFPPWSDVFDFPHINITGPD